MIFYQLQHYILTVSAYIFKVFFFSSLCFKTDDDQSCVIKRVGGKAMLGFVFLFLSLDDLFSIFNVLLFTYICFRFRLRLSTLSSQNIHPSGLKRKIKGPHLVKKSLHGLQLKVKRTTD